MANSQGIKTEQTKTLAALIKRRISRALVGVLAIGLSYLAFVYAIDSGNLLAYVAIGVFVIIALHEFFASIDWRKRS